MPPDRLAPFTADAAWRALHTAASAPYRAAGHFAWHFARGKLGRDPVFRGMLERGDLPAGARVVDIGCGQGLMASLLQSCGALAQAGRWPTAWPQAPHAFSYHGIELMPRDVERARLGTATLALAPSFECNDMRRAALPPCDLVVILDVLHYVDHAAQSALLTRVRNALLEGAAARAAQAPPAAGARSTPELRSQHAAHTAHTAAGANNARGKEAQQPSARLLLRVGDAASTRGFAVSQWVDRAVTLLRGHAVPPTWGRPLAAWVALLQELGFAVRSVPMSQGTPFANVLLVADVIGPA